MNNGMQIIDPVKESEQLLKIYKQRRTVRSFSDKPVSQEVVEHCIAIAGTAPSGANMQPWHFVLVKDPAMKKKIRQESEKVEEDFYKNLNDEWREKLKPLSTDSIKTFLEEAPYLIVVFMQKYGIDEAGNKVKHYYQMESNGIAVGFLISALNQCGLSTLTYTPAPMGFLNKLLDRGENERALMILPVGYPADDYIPPNITKKPLNEILSVF